MQKESKIYLCSQKGEDTVMHVECGVPRMLETVGILFAVAEGGQKWEVKVARGSMRVIRC